MRESPKHLPGKEECVQSLTGKVFGWNGFQAEGQFEEVAGAGVRPER